MCGGCNFLNFRLINSSFCSFTITSFGTAPILRISKVTGSFFTVKINLPSKSVKVPLLVPFSRMVAPGTVESSPFKITCPEIDICPLAIVVIRKMMKVKVNLIKDSQMFFIMQHNVKCSRRAGDGQHLSSRYQRTDLEKRKLSCSRFTRLAAAWC